MSNKLVHLHCHSMYSYLDGFGSAKQYISKVKELGMTACAITDHGVIDGCLDWQKECDKQEIGCILGAECYIVPNMKIKEQREKRGHITILVKSLKGWTELCRLLTDASLTGFYHRPRIDFGSLLNSDLSGFVILTGCTASFINLSNGMDFLLDLHDRMKGRLFLEAMPHDMDMQHKHNEKLLQIHEELKIPLVCSNDCHYIEEEDWETQEVLLAINRNAKWHDKNRWRFEIKGLHLRTEREMKLAFRKHCFTSKQIDEAIDNTAKIADKCSNFRIPKQEISLPRPYENVDDDEMLKKLCSEGLEKFNKSADKRYKGRFDEEFKLISKKNFSRYFLIFYDIIQWCKKNDIPTGAGRGSVGGSLIAYLIGITKRIDPIEFDLSFARFISEDRQDWPDIDCDFAKRDRDKVVDYIKNKYGVEHTCGISTPMRLKSKASVQAVARVFDVPAKDVAGFTKTISVRDRENALQSAVDGDGYWFAKKYPDVIYFAKKLENQVRGRGRHPAGQIISKDDLTSGTKCVLVKQGKFVIANWNMENCEYCGLAKMDFLGLSTLSVLHEAQRLLNNLPEYSENKFDIDNIPLDDKKVFDLINSGKTAGMFQISTKWCADICKQVEIEDFRDIVAVVALARPGPSKSGMTDKYIARKHGEKWDNMHPIYEDVAKDTYGLLVYQEQVMRIISRVAGLSESTADKIRKVIAKKRDIKEFEQFWKQFRDGCRKQKTLSDKEAEDFWKGLLEWAEYGFGKAHSVAYALIGYQTAWLKAHYPAEFICACLSFADYDNNRDEDFRQKTQLLEEIVEKGIQIIPPKIGFSDPIRWLVKDNKLYVPFVEISGFGEHQANKSISSKPVGERRLKSFFGPEYDLPQKEKTKNDLILEELLCHESNKIPSNEVLSKYFSISFDSKDSSYETLKNILGFEFPEEGLSKIKRLEVEKEDIAKRLVERKRFSNNKLLECTKCELREECTSPVMPSVGLYNMMIIGEAPGKKENQHRRGFYEGAPAGELLWSELDKYGLTRRMFHVSNCCKCWPSISKTPKPNHIEACSIWLNEEIKELKPRLILAFGNTNNFFFTGKSSGINSLSGTTEWNQKYQSWVCFATHPSAAKRNLENKEYFEAGIKTFAVCVDLLTDLICF